MSKVILSFCVFFFFFNSYCKCFFKKDSLIDFQSDPAGFGSTDGSYQAH